MKKLYYFGNLEDPWKAWVFYGSEVDCRRWLKKEGVDRADIDEWMEKAYTFTKDKGFLQ